MKNIIKDKEIKGYKFADGVHWYWGNEEVAVINDNNEIEWYKRPHNYPEELVEAIRERKEYPAAHFDIDIRKISRSTTQGYYQIDINGKKAITFDAYKMLGKDGDYHFDLSDEELGKLLITFFWHKYDHVYHYSDKAKDIFYPDWNKENYL